MQMIVKSTESVVSSNKSPAKSKNISYPQVDIFLADYDVKSDCSFLLSSITFKTRTEFQQLYYTLLVFTATDLFSCAKLVKGI